MLLTQVLNYESLDPKLLSGLKDASFVGIIILFYYDSLDDWLRISSIAVFSASSLYQLSKAKQLWTARKQQQP